MHISTALSKLSIWLLLLFSVSAVAQVHQDGSWGPVIPWTYVPVSAANMPDGRVLSWASNERYSFPSGRPEFTYTGIWDPRDNSITEIDHPSHDMFCAHQVMLEDGRVFVAGGRRRDVTDLTSVFDLATEQWVPVSPMNRPRWYPTNVALSDGTIFTAIGDGGGNTGEVYDPASASWQLLSGVDFNPMILNYPDSSYGERDWWPLLHLAPDGDIFHAGPTPQMHTIDTSGVGSAQEVGAEFTDWYPKHGTSVMYDEGKILIAGGWAVGSALASTNQAVTIDINGPSPVIAPTQPMVRARKFHNGVMLPNGEVLVIGGNTSGEKFSDNGSIYTTEIWNPVTETWREGAPMQVPRNYHSVALLLNDGTVLSAGGGLCNCSADHADGQVYYPPYLYNSDGSLATRPEIQSAPAAIRAGDQFTVTTDSNVAEFSLIKMSSTTHAINTDLRYLKVPSSGSDGAYQLTAHGNPNVLTPGYWMLFALNSAGTPSEARVIQVRSMNDDDPLPQGAMDLTFNSFADLSGFQVNGSASGNGAVLRLTNLNQNQAGSAFYTTAASISSTTAFSSRIDFRVHGSGSGGSGLALVLQGNEKTALGQAGEGLGYDGVVNSLAIEIDNSGAAAGDVNGNHVAVHIGGDSGAPLASYVPAFDLEDGNTHSLWVDYSPNSKILDVYLDQAAGGSKPALPVISVPNLDLPAVVGSLAYFGFSAATAIAVNNHDVEHWSLSLVSGSNPLVIDPVDGTPQPSDGPVIFDASATGEGLQYRWSFGDGTPQTPYSSSSSISHTYPGPGRYSVTLTVRDINGIEQSIQFIQAVYPPTTSEPPSASSTIIVEQETGAERVWNVNPDNDTVTVIDAVTNSKLTEIAVGADPRALALAPDGSVWVTNKDDATITVIDTRTLNVTATRQLPAGSEPHGLVFDDVGGFAFVALESLAQVWKLDVYSDSAEVTVDAGANPRHLSITGAADRLYVSQFISPPFPGESTTSPQTTSGGQPAGGEIVVLNPSTMTVQKTITLEHSNRQAAELTGPGFPNYLGPAIISPSGLSAFVPSKQDNILLGSSRDSGSPLNHEHTVRAVTSVIDLGNDLDVVGQRIDHDNASVARNGAFGPYGVYTFVALEGNREIVVVDAIAHEEIFRFSVGLAPQSVAVSADGNRLFVHNFLDRTVTIADASQLMSGSADNVTVLATVDTVTAERLPADVLLGKRLFYDAADPRLALDSYMSCASCHNDGGHDGRVWDLSSLGEGLRNTISLKGHGGMSLGLLHWTANFDEIQDFENQIRDLSGGTGLMSDTDFAQTQSLLGAPKAGLSQDLDALATYVSSLTRFGRSPYRDLDGTLSASGQSGRQIFKDANCSSCHADPEFTDSPIGGAHDIGTITSASGQTQGSPITALDTPTLKGLWATAPYLHDGSASSIIQAIEAHSLVSLGGATLSTSDLANLESYLKQIDDLESTTTLWQGRDIGAVGIAGSFLDVSGSITLHSGDGKIWNEADEFYFAYQTLSGDGEIIAQVLDVSSTAPWAKAALMIRETLDAGSANAAMIVTPERGVGFQYRTTTDGSSAPKLGGSPYNALTAPKWIRVIRTGPQVTGYHSEDGINWTQSGQVVMSLANTVYVGLGASAGGTTVDAVFDNVTITPANAPQADVTPPTAPQNLVANASGQNAIDLSWSGSVDAETGVAGYRVYRDGLSITDVTATTYSDTGLTADTTYTYTVSAFDASPAANESGQSAPASATTGNASSVVTPNVINQTQTAAEGNIIAANLIVGTVTAAFSDTVLAGSVISQNPAPGMLVAQGTAVDFVVSNGPPPSDSTPPTAPQNLTASAAGTTSISLTWSASTDSESGVAGYRIYRDGLAVTDVPDTSYLDSGLAPNTNYTYTVSSFDASPAANESAQSAPANATTFSAGSWQGGDIGTVGVTGSFSENVGTITLSSGGGKLWKSADDFHFAYQTMVGDGEIVARVASVDSTHVWAKAAVMIRETLDAGSSNAAMVVTPARGVGFQYRVATGGDSGPKRGGSAYNTLTAPQWVRVTRDGTTLTGYYSQDGLNWTQAGQVTISMTNTVLVGLGASSKDGTTITAVFDSVAIAPSSPPLPDITPPTVPQDLMVIASGASSVNLSWSASTDSGSGIAGYRLYRDGVAMADVVGTSYLDTELTPNTNYTYTVSAFDASVPANESNQSAPVSVTTDATISWQGLDIGAVGISGSFVENSGTFTLQGGDGKIWSAADSFYFVYKTLDGDGEILSRVSSVTSTAAWGKAAVMIRETLDAGSTNATMIVTPSRGVGFQYRATTDGDSGPKRGGAAYNALTAPKWIRVTRVGTTLTGYYSEDGLNWTQAGQVTIAMANTVYVGLGVSSANTTISAEFDSVSAISLP